MLAAIIAHRARWRDGYNPHGLEFGEALLGDWENLGMTQQQYRTAKEHLLRWGFATFRTTNRGTIGRLTGTRLFSIIPAANNEQSNDPANEQGNDPANDKLRTDNKHQRSSEEDGVTARAQSRPASWEELQGYGDENEIPDQCIEAFANLNNKKGWRLMDWRKALCAFWERWQTQ